MNRKGDYRKGRLKEAGNSSRGLMNKNRMRQLWADERTNDRKVHIHQAPKL